MVKQKFNKDCVKYDCEDCGGKGYIEGWNGTDPSTLVCPGNRLVKSNILKALNKDLHLQDEHIHELFMEGLTYSEMADLLFLGDNGPRQIKDYIALSRKIDINRWPYRRPPSK